MNARQHTALGAVLLIAAIAGCERGDVEADAREARRTVDSLSALSDGEDSSATPVVEAQRLTRRGDSLLSEGDRRDAHRSYAQAMIQARRAELIRELHASSSADTVGTPADTTR